MSRFFRYAPLVLLVFAIAPSSFGQLTSVSPAVEERKTVTRDVIGKELPPGKTTQPVREIGISGPGIVKPPVLDLNDPVSIANRAKQVIKASIPELEAKMEQVNKVTRKVKTAFDDGAKGANGAIIATRSNLADLRAYLKKIKGADDEEKLSANLPDLSDDELKRDEKKDDELDKELADEEKKKKEEEYEKQRKKAEKELDDEQAEADAAREAAKADPDHPHHKDPENAWTRKDENGNVTSKTRKEELAEEAEKEEETHSDDEFL